MVQFLRMADGLDTGELPKRESFSFQYFPTHRCIIVILQPSHKHQTIFQPEPIVTHFDFLFFYFAHDLTSIIVNAVLAIVLLLLLTILAAPTRPENCHFMYAPPLMMVVLVVVMLMVVVMMLLVVQMVVTSILSSHHRQHHFHLHDLVLSSSSS